jgi:general secretion pathway protein D
VREQKHSLAVRGGGKGSIVVTRHHEIEHGPGRGSGFLKGGLLTVALSLLATVGCSGPQQGTVAAAPVMEPAAPVNNAAPAEPIAQDGADDPRVRDVFENLSLTDQEKRRAAEFYLNQARKNFGDGDYRSAAENFEKSLQNNPTSRDARDGLAESLMLLGRRDGEIQSVIQQLGEEIVVGQQARLVEVRQHMEKARAYLQEGDATNALSEASRAREQLIYFNYDVDITELQAAATALYDEVRDAKLRLDAKLDRDRQAAAAEEADLVRRRDEERKQARIAALVSRVKDAMIQRNYKVALETAERILDLDPQNDVAKRLRERANSFLMDQRRVDIMDKDADQITRVWEDLGRITIPYEDPFNFPEERFWREEVQPRLEGLRNLSFEESPEVRQMRRELAKEYPSFVFPESTMGDAISYIRTLSGLNITVDPEIDLEENTVNLSIRDVKLGEALDLILEHTGFAYTFKENTLFITTPDNAFGDKMFDVYNITDLLNKVKDFPGPQIRVSSTDDEDEGAGNPFSFGDDEDDEEPLTGEDLAELIIESTGGEDVWDESGSEIVPSSGQLLITATRELHLATASFLENLRANSDVFVIVETRFIDMVDDFLEDIGVDSRNLGQPPGQGFGTAFGTLNSARTGGTDIGFNNLGDPTNPALAMGQDRTAGRIEHVLDGFVGAAAGERLTSALRGLTLQVTWLDPFQINAIVRATQEQRSARTVTAPRVTASNGQRVHVSVITQRSYVQDYELVSGGTGQVVSEVADPVIDTFQDGVVLDVRPVISSDRKYITLDVRPTLASLINGVISTVTISLGTLNTAASQVEIDLPEISLQQAFTSVTVPDGGTVLLGGFRSLNERKYESSVPLLGKIPFFKNAFRRKAYLNEKRSLYILITAKVVDLRAEERDLYN